MKAKEYLQQVTKIDKDLINGENNANIAELIAAKEDVIRTIEQLPAIEYDLLHKMYIGIVKADESGSRCIVYLALDEVAEIYHKTRKWASNVHRRAVANVQKLINACRESEEMKDEGKGIS